MLTTIGDGWDDLSDEEEIGFMELVLGVGFV
jgi:hypothetical protein